MSFSITHRDYGDGRCLYCKAEFKRVNANDTGTMCGKQGCKDKAHKARMKAANERRKKKRGNGD